MDISLKDIKAFAQKTLLLSGKIAMKYYRKNGVIKTKHDKSIVTIADEEIEQFIRQHISKNFPKHNIVGEEQGGSIKAGSYNWVIDPIDGTSSFQAGRPVFTTLLALYKGYTPVLGAIYQPITNEILLAIEDKIFYNGKKITPKTKNSKITLATTSPELLNKKGKEYFSKLSQSYKNTIYGGDAYNYMLLALGNIDFIYEQGLKPHDFLPLIPILKNANAKFTDIAGKEIKGNYKGLDFIASR